MIVTYYHRRPIPGCHSIERLFKDVRDALPKNVKYKISISKFESRGFLRRVYNTIEAIFHQRDINHITGDVHYLTLFLNKKITLLTIHDCVALKRLGGIKKKILLLFWYWLPIKRSALVSVISESTKREIFRYIKCNKNKFRVIHDPVSSLFKPSKYRFNIYKPTILQIGTRYNKNLLRVSEALKDIPCHLNILGDLSIEQKRVLDSCNIKYSSLSNISDYKVVEIYKQSDMIIFASTYEGFGLPIIEANAIGRPVIASNILSMPEVANDAACLVNPFNVESIKAGILKVIHDVNYREKLIENGFKNVQRFKPKVIVAQYVNLYKELLNKIQY